MIGILSDAHGNFYAFEHALEILRETGVDEIIFLGDAVGYFPSTKVVDLLMSFPRKAKCIRGNHEDMLIHASFSEKQDQVYQLGKIKSLMSEAHIDFISGWDTTYTRNSPVGKLLFIHGSPSDPTYGYIYSDTDLSAFDTDADFVFMGNSHYPFVRKHQRVTYVNVGSCGLPRDDGRYGSVAVFDPENGVAKIIRFDISALSASTLAEIPPVHRSVTALLNRKKKELIGEIYD